jgi:hypothetical protein
MGGFVRILHADQFLGSLPLLIGSARLLLVVKLPERLRFSVPSFVSTNLLDARECRLAINLKHRR